MREVSVIRVAVWPETDSVNSCTLKATNFSTLSLACNNHPGLYVQPVVMLVSMLTFPVTFTFVPLLNNNVSSPWAKLVTSFQLNETDMALRIWPLTEERMKQVEFSQGVLYNKRVLLVSSKQYHTHQEINVNPFDQEITVLIGCTLFCLVALETFYLTIHVDPRHIWKNFCKSMLDFLDFSGLKNRALSKRWVGMPAATAFILCSSVVLRFAFGSFVTVTLVRTPVEPFNTLQGLASRIETGKNVLVYKTSASILDYANNSDQWRAIILRARTVDSDAEAAENVLLDQRTVYRTTDSRVPYLVKRRCGMFRTIDLSDTFLDDGFSLVFRRGSKLASAFDSAISLARSTIQHRAAKPPAHLECPPVNNDAYATVLEPEHYRLLAVMYVVMCSSGIVLFSLEFSIKKCFCFWKASD